MSTESTDVSKLTVIDAANCLEIGGEPYRISLNMRKASKLFELTGHYVLTQSTSVEMVINPNNFFQMLSVMLEGAVFTPDQLMNVITPLEFMEAGAKMYLVITKFVPSDDQIKRVNSMLRSNLPESQQVPNEKPQMNISSDSGVTEYDGLDLLPDASGL